MTKRIVAIDAKDFFRKSRLPGKVFKAPMGVAVRIDDYDSFASNYGVNITKLKSEFRIMSNLKIIKSFDILRKMGPKGIDFIEKFVNSLMDEVDSITIYYTVVPSTKITQVNVYWEDKGGLEQITPIEFLGQLANYYPHICAWKYLEDNPDENDVVIYMDSFEGSLTPAWDVLEWKKNIYVGSDSTNCAISFADLVAKLIDYRLERQHKKLYYKDILEVTSDLKSRVVFVDQLEKIAPKSKTKINLNEKLLRPVVYILKEGYNKEITQQRTEKDVIEGSPAMEKILNFAAELGTNVKFFDLSSDQATIKEDDYFVYLGENGKKFAELMVTLGHKIRTKSIAELK